MADFDSLARVTARREDSELAVAGWLPARGNIVINNIGLISAWVGESQATGTTPLYAVGTRIRAAGTVYTVRSHETVQGLQTAKATPVPAIGATIANAGVSAWDVYGTGRGALSVLAPPQHYTAKHFPTTGLTDYDDHTRIDDDTATARTGLSVTAAEVEAALVAMFDSRDDRWDLVKYRGVEFVSEQTEMPLAQGQRTLAVRDGDRMVVKHTGGGDVTLNCNEIIVEGQDATTISLGFSATVLSRPDGVTGIEGNNVTAVQLFVAAAEDGILVRRSGKTVTEPVASAIAEGTPEGIFRSLAARATTIGADGSGNRTWTYADGTVVTLTLPNVGGARFTARRAGSVVAVKTIGTDGGITYSEN